MSENRWIKLGMSSSPSWAKDRTLCRVSPHIRPKAWAWPKRGWGMIFSSPQDSINAWNSSIIGHISCPLKLKTCVIGSQHHAATWRNGIQSGVWLNEKSAFMPKPQKFTFSEPSKVIIQSESFSAKNGSIYEEIVVELKFWRRIHEVGRFVVDKVMSESQLSAIWQFFTFDGRQDTLMAGRLPSMAGKLLLWPAAVFSSLLPTFVLSSAGNLCCILIFVCFRVLFWVFLVLASLFICIWVVFALFIELFLHFVFCLLVVSLPD